MLAGWEGSAHDALVLADAIERDGGLSVPEGNKFTHSQISQIVLKPLCSVLYANPPLPCWEILSSGCWLCLKTRVPASLQGVRYHLRLPCMELVFHCWTCVMFYLWTPPETCIAYANLFSLLFTIICLDDDWCIVYGT